MARRRGDSPRTLLRRCLRVRRHVARGVAGSSQELSRIDGGAARLRCVRCVLCHAGAGLALSLPLLPALRIAGWLGHVPQLRSTVLCAVLRISTEVSRRCDVRWRGTTILSDDMRTIFIVYGFRYVVGSSPSPCCTCMRGANATSSVSMKSECLRTHHILINHVAMAAVGLGSVLLVLGPARAPNRFGRIFLSRDRR